MTAGWALRMDRRRVVPVRGLPTIKKICFSPIADPIPVCIINGLIERDVTSYSSLEDWASQRFIYAAVLMVKHFVLEV